MHQKEKAFQELFYNAFSITCFTEPTFQTDCFGTFSGEVKREVSPLKAARQKCDAAFNEFGHDLIISSEGSFGSSYGFITIDHELLLLKDYKNNFEIIVEFSSYDTNFNQQKIKTEEELNQFLTQVKFPSHAVIVKSSSGELFKGIDDVKVLRKITAHCLNQNGEFDIETDMRAMYNPSRMLVIEKATERLIDKMNTLCPECQIPGFDVVERVFGLPCEVCNQPTRSLKEDVYQCKVCEHVEVKQFPNEKRFEDPMYCDFCNP
jgi:hypothetical protein